VEFFHLYCG